MIVKLLEGKIVARAFRGFKELALDEIQTIYGDPPVLSSFEYPSSIRQTITQKGAFWACMTYFDSVKLVTIAKIIEL